MASVLRGLANIFQSCCRPMKKRKVTREAPVCKEDPQLPFKLDARSFVEVFSVVCRKCGATLCYKNEESMDRVWFGLSYRYWCSTCRILREADVYGELQVKRKFSVSSVKCSGCRKTSHYLQGEDTVTPITSRRGETYYWCRFCCHFKEAGSIIRTDLSKFLRNSKHNVIS